MNTTETRPLVIVSDVPNAVGVLPNRGAPHPPEPGGSEHCQNTELVGEWQKNEEALQHLIGGDHSSPKDASRNLIWNSTFQIAFDAPPTDDPTVNTDGCPIHPLEREGVGRGFPWNSACTKRSIISTAQQISFTMAMEGRSGSGVPGVLEPRFPTQHWHFASYWNNKV